MPSYHASTVLPTVRVRQLWLKWMKRKTRDPKLVSDCFVFLCDDFQQMASHFQMIVSEKLLISCDFSGLSAFEDILAPHLNVFA